MKMRLGLCELAMCDRMGIGAMMEQQGGKQINDGAW